MLRQKEKAELSQAFTQKLGWRDSQEGKVIVLTSGGVKEKDKKSFTFSNKTQKLKSGKESKKEGTVCHLYEETV